MSPIEFALYTNARLKNIIDALPNEKLFIEIQKISEVQKSVSHLIKPNEQVRRLQAITEKFQLIKYNTILKQIPATNSIDRALKFMSLGYYQYDFTDLIKVDSTETKRIKIDESSRLKRIITDVYKDNWQLFKVSSREFEEMIAELLRSQGFEVELTKQTRDNGYDILALKSVDLKMPFKCLVECKRYNATNKVGVGIIRSFKDVIATEQANRGIIVTTSYFTKDAINKQKDTPYLLDYRDKEKVIEWVNDYWTKN